eukprot:scaffold20149_cov61-Phaeocystis_antarctica.AAC.1
MSSTSMPSEGKPLGACSSSASVSSRTFSMSFSASMASKSSKRSSDWTGGRATGEIPCWVSARWISGSSTSLSSNRKGRGAAAAARRRSAALPKAWTAGIIEVATDEIEEAERKPILGKLKSCIVPGNSKSARMSSSTKRCKATDKVMEASEGSPRPKWRSRGSKRSGCVTSPTDRAAEPNARLAASDANGGSSAMSPKSSVPTMLANGSASANAKPNDAASEVRLPPTASESASRGAGSPKSSKSSRSGWVGRPTLCSPNGSSVIEANEPAGITLITREPPNSSSTPNASKVASWPGISNSISSGMPIPTNCGAVSDVRDPREPTPTDSMPTFAGQSAKRLPRSAGNSKVSRASAPLIGAFTSPNAKSEVKEPPARLICQGVRKSRQRTRALCQGQRGGVAQGTEGEDWGG